MPYGLLADLVLLAHALFVVFVVGGGLLVLYRPRVAWAHLPAAVWGAWIEFTGGVCPLTPLENHFRELAGSGGYAGTFLERYLVQFLYPPGLTREIQIGLGLAVVALNVAIYVRVWRKHRGDGTRSS